MQASWFDLAEVMLGAREVIKLLLKVFAGVVGVIIALTGWASDYKDLVVEGYRWVATDHAYACPTKEDLREITGDVSESDKLHMVEELRACFLLKGALVKVIKDDRTAGMVQIRAAEFTSDLWTYNKYLSKHPIKDTFAVIETPETSGLLLPNMSAEIRTAPSTRISPRTNSTNR